ncbi:MAG: hypothetical protein AAFN04_08985 [Pseudomonadota bacterium]
MDVESALNLGFDPPKRTLTIGVTGHREGNPVFSANRDAIEREVAGLLASIQQRVASVSPAGCARLATNLANGCDLSAARIATELKIEVLAPLPFGADLNLALNTLNADWPEVERITLGHQPQEADEHRNWASLKEAIAKAKCFELADQDAALKEYLTLLAGSNASRKLQLEFESLIGKRTKLASRITVEQSDVLLAIWDGSSPSAVGGTRDTMAEALAADVPVLWLDARAPERLKWLDDIGDLAVAGERNECADTAAMADLVCAHIEADWKEVARADEQLNASAWQPNSQRRFHAYRRVERLFDGEGKPFTSVKQTYETPKAAAAGEEPTMIGKIRGLLEPDPASANALANQVVARFAAADGISTRLSDAYRGGMVANFLLSAAAIIGGVAYLPLFGPDGKWPFAALELTLLLAIVAITLAGIRGQWHQRWFQTRRAAEYLRHAPIMAAIGCARPRGDWPSSPDIRWPELYAREVIKGVGIPEMKITQSYLKRHLEETLRPFFMSQRDYHKSKAKRLARVHANLDRVSQALFVLAIISVSAYLLTKLAATFGVLDASILDAMSKPTTFLGVAFPTLGAAIAGIRYFGDFERFAGISEVTASKLERLIRRSDLLLQSQEKDVSYQDFVDLVRKMDDFVIDEIASWQSIFGTKKISIPV